MSAVTKEVIDNLARLARIKLAEGEKEKLLADLEKILNYFKELQSLDTSGVEPMTGGTHEKNVFREDGERPKIDQEAGVEAFPETSEGYLKIPPVFETGDM